MGAAAAAARPAHTGTARENSHHIPRFPRALLLPPQPFLILGMSVRGGRRCQSHGTGLAKHCHFSCKSKQLLQSSWWVPSEQCYEEQHPPAGHNGPQNPAPAGTSPCHYTPVCHQPRCYHRHKKSQVLPRPLPSLLHCRLQVLDILRAIIVYFFLVPQHQLLPQHVQEPDSRETLRTSSSPGAPWLTAPNGTERDAAHPATCPQPLQPLGLMMFAHAGEARRLCPASCWQSHIHRHPGACEVPQQRDSTPLLRTGCLWGAGAAQRLLCHSTAPFQAAAHTHTPGQGNRSVQGNAPRGGRSCSGTCAARSPPCPRSHRKGHAAGTADTL